MLQRVLLINLSCVVILSGVPALAAGNSAPARFMPTYGITLPIESHVKFCARLPQHCEPDDRGTQRVVMTAERMAQLDEINRLVNASVRPTPQEVLYGVKDYWAFPDQQLRGDCNAYTLWKRDLLAVAGWPISSLLITVVQVTNGEGHAVLTARTSEGDFVLDNLSPKVTLWSELPYHFIMRESSVNPRVWLALDGKLPHEHAAMAPATTKP